MFWELNYRVSCHYINYCRLNRIHTITIRVRLSECEKSYNNIEAPSTFNKSQFWQKEIDPGLKLELEPDPE